MSSFEFDPTATQFNLINALSLAEASQLAYEQTWESVEKRARQWGFVNFESFDVKGTEAFLASNDAMAILAFRGTQEPQDWLTDLNAKFVAWPSGRVHKGFQEGLDDIFDNVSSAIDQHCQKGQKLWVTGHSLGAALATLAVDRLTREYHEVAGLYTFGSPRVGDKAFARAFDDHVKDKTFRFVNNEDIVTLVPPAFAGYRHVGQLRYFDNTGKLDQNVSWGKMLTDIAQSWIVRSSEEYKDLKAKYPNGLEDHNIAHYIELIRKNIGNHNPKAKTSALQGFLDWVNRNK